MTKLNIPITMMITCNAYLNYSTSITQVVIEILTAGRRRMHKVVTVSVCNVRYTRTIYLWQNRRYRCVLHYGDWIMHFSWINGVNLSTDLGVALLVLGKLYGCPGASEKLLNDNGKIGLFLTTTKHDKLRIVYLFHNCSYEQKTYIYICIYIYTKP